MSAQPATIGFPFSSTTAERIDEVIGKMQQLGSGTGVGANLYQDTNEIKIRFGDHAHGPEYVVLTPFGMAAVRSFIDGGDSPDDKKIHALLAQGDRALVHAGEYLREQQGKLNLNAMATVQPS